jgi:hypothetical protein
MLLVWMSWWNTLVWSSWWLPRYCVGHGCTCSINFDTCFIICKLKEICVLAGVGHRNSTVQQPREGEGGRKDRTKQGPLRNHCPRWSPGCVLSQHPLEGASLPGPWKADSLWQWNLWMPWEDPGVCLGCLCTRAWWSLALSFTLQRPTTCTKCFTLLSVKNLLFFQIFYKFIHP